MKRDRPKITIEPDTTDKIVNTIAGFILLLNLAGSVWLYMVSPQTIPGHFNVYGHANRYDDKAIVFIIPGLALLIFIFLNVLTKYPQVYNYPRNITEENAEASYRQGVKMIRFLTVGIMLLLFGGVYLMYSGIKNNFLPFHLWELIAAVFLTIALPIFLAFRYYPVKNIHE